MSISNVHMPSFTLVLTTGHQSHRRHPSTITFDILSSAPDRLMTTIDLRDELEDDRGHNTDVSTASIGQEDNDSAVAFTEAGLSSSGNVEKEANHSIKAYLLRFVQKIAVKGKLAFVKKKSPSRLIATPVP